MKKSLLILIVLVNLAQAAGAHPLRVRVKVDSVLICQSRSAYAYHAYECRGLARCTHGIVKITKAQAVKLGYRACKICYR